MQKVNRKTLIIYKADYKCKKTELNRKECSK